MSNIWNITNTHYERSPQEFSALDDTLGYSVCACCGASSHAGSHPQPDGVCALAAEAERERDEIRDVAQRVQAEYENYRKRMLNQAAAAQEKSIARVLGGFLDTLDSLDAAVAASYDGGLSDGLEAIRSQLIANLSKLGLRAISETGVVFDPTVHEAVTAEPGPEPEHTVVEVLRVGYVVGDVVLRAAMVRVRGG